MKTFRNCGSSSPRRRCGRAATDRSRRGSRAPRARSSPSTSTWRLLPASGRRIGGMRTVAIGRLNVTATESPGAGPRAGRRARASGKSRVQTAASAIVATPPATTAGTVPSSAAAAPDSNAPSSFEALMKTISTASTRPRSSSGVTIATVVERMFMLIMSTKPLTASAASESGSQLREPEDDHAHAEERRRRRAASCPAFVRSGRRASTAPASERADRRRAAQQAEPDRAGVRGSSARRPARARSRRRGARRRGRARSRRAGPACGG